MNDAVKPFVLVFDIDGTMIGDITPQIMLYEIHMALKQQDRKVNVMNIKDFQYKLKKGGIIRPYFFKFIKTIKEYYPNVEFFIYTASERKWATFLISQIEKISGIKFNKPIFARDKCMLINNSYKKGISIISLCILKSLRKKYGVLKKEDLENNIMIIDNNPDVYDNNDKKHVLVCPSYDFKCPENLPVSISEIVYNVHNEIIMKILHKYLALSHSHVVDYIEFQKAYYTYYIRFISSLKSDNSIQSQDKFLLYLMNIMIHKRFTKFNSKTIAYIDHKLKKRYT